MQPMDERADAFQSHVDHLETDVGQHFEQAMSARTLGELDQLEQYHRLYVRRGLDTMDYWVRQLENCVDVHGDAVPQAAALAEELDWLRVEATLHSMQMAVAGDMGVSGSEEHRHLSRMNDGIELMRGLSITMTGEMDGVACPPTDDDVPVWVDPDPAVDIDLTRAPDRDASEWLAH